MYYAFFYIFTNYQFQYCNNILEPIKITEGHMITLEYMVRETDYLIHQLYVATQSSHVKKTRTRARIIGSITFVLFSLLFLLLNNYFLTIFFLVFCPLWYFIYPLWERRYYVNYYKKFILEHYKNRINRKVNIEINIQDIIINDDWGETKIFSLDIIEITELPNLILLQLKAGAALLIPKSEIDIDTLRPRLKDFAKDLKVEYLDKNTWRWR